MKIIGITGNSGAGKTTICEILNKKYNAYIIDADAIAKQLTTKQTMYLKTIIEYFGDNIINENGELRRKKLADIIYNDKEKRNKLNEITFNYVVEEIKNKIQELKHEKLVIIDAPLLFESKLDKVCDIVIGVIAQEEEKIKRICKRDKISGEIAKKRLDIQNSNEYIKEKADYIIYNEDSIAKLEEEIEWFIKLKSCT